MPKVLVVDDRPENLVAMKNVLSGMDLVVVTAISGIEALSLILSHEFAVVLLDIQMPEMDGFEAATLIRGNEDTQNLPIIFVTAASEDEACFSAAYETGAVDYLTKPINPDIVRAKVRIFVELYDKNRALEATARELKVTIDALERSNQEFSAFAHTAAHDLKAPVRHIGNFIQFFLEDEGKEISHSGRSQLETVQRATDRLTNMIDNLLDYARVDTSTREFETVDLGSVVGHVVSDLEAVIEEAHARVEIGDLPTISGDESQLYQLFLNLLANSVKFRRKGVDPIIKLTGKAVSDPPDVDENHVPMFRICVEDNGIGFDQAYIDKVFQPFKRLTTKAKFEGSGIGMATAQKIVARHHGSITAKGVSDQGSTFIVTLPAIGTVKNATSRRA